MWLSERPSDFSPLERALSFKIFEKMQAISLYWFAVQQQTSTLRRQKIGLFYAKFNAEFNGSVFFSTGSGQKMAKTKVVQKNANRRR